MQQPDPKQRPLPNNDYERTVLKNIDSFGWHCTSVAPRVGEEGESFSYTVGLYHSFGSSELLLIGLPSKTAHAIFSIYVDRLRAGDPIPLDAQSDALIQGYPCLFVPAPRSRSGDYVLSALWYYAETDFPLHQVVYPDREGRFPWHSEASQAFRSQQPVLGRGGEA
jgi:hypothetical protein